MHILYTVLEQAKRISAVPSSNLRGVSVPLSSLSPFSASIYFPSFARDDLLLLTLKA